MLIFGNGRFDDGLEKSLKNVAIWNSEAKTNLTTQRAQLYTKVYFS
jgi:hypothetical protein